jgi:ApaG protein
LNKNPNSTAVTDGIRVEARAQFLPNESDSERRQFLFVYRIRITNEGEKRVQLFSRRWVIVDANNQQEEIIGEGVVGKQPLLSPGQDFEYTCYCPLRTEWGTMEGTYTFHDDDKNEIEASVGRFFLVPDFDNALVP